jgi:hypothetical protein
MIVVYVAGPFRSTNKNGKSNAWGVQKNVMRAMELALEVWKRGAVALCPHSNTMFFQDADGCADDVWLKGDIELLKRSDAILMTDDYLKSSGARHEHDWAKAHGVPVLYSVDELDEWLRENRRLRGCCHEETSVCAYCM